MALRRDCRVGDWPWDRWPRVSLPLARDLRGDRRQGSRDAALADDPVLDYGNVAEVLFLMERLAHPSLPAGKGLTRDARSGGFLAGEECVALRRDCRVGNWP